MNNKYYIIAKDKKTGYKLTWNKIIDIIEKIYNNSYKIDLRNSSYIGDYIIITNNINILKIYLNKFPNTKIYNRVIYNNIPKNSFIFDFYIDNEFKQDIITKLNLLYFIP